MNASLFVDTNILVYALDLDAGRKRETALRVIEAGWQTLGETALSVQVLQELHVNLVRRGRTFDEATQIVRDFYHWPVIENTLALLDDALDLQARFRLSLWDAMIVAAAGASGARELLTEDLHHGKTTEAFGSGTPLFRRNPCGIFAWNRSPVDRASFARASPA